MTIESELLPCPFCGTADPFLEDYDAPNHGRRLVCRNSKCAVRMYRNQCLRDDEHSRLDTVEEMDAALAERWNSRATPQTSDELRAIVKRRFDDAWERTMKEQVNHPLHYGGEDNPYEAIKVIEAWQLGFHLGNAVKYISRAGKKDALLQDLKKARWYLDRFISQLEKASG